MFLAAGDVFIVGLVVGSLSVYSYFEQKKLFFSISLLFFICFYVGFFVTNISMFIPESKTTIAVFRMILGAIFIGLAFYSFIPIQGYFHRESHPLWVGLSLLFLYLGWHSGQVIHSVGGFLFYLLLFIVSFIIGNYLQGHIEQSIRKRRYVSTFPLATLLFFSVLFLL